MRTIIIQSQIKQGTTIFYIPGLRRKSLESAGYMSSSGLKDAPILFPVVRIFDSKRHKCQGKYMEQASGNKTLTLNKVNLAKYMKNTRLSKNHQPNESMPAVKTIFKEWFRSQVGNYMSTARYLSARHLLLVRTEREVIVQNKNIFVKRDFCSDNNQDKFRKQTGRVVKNTLWMSSSTVNPSYGTSFL